MIAIFAAMESEVLPFLASGCVTETVDVAGYPVTHMDYGGLSAVICRTGIGRCAGEAAAAVLQRHPLRAALSVGIAGGLAPNLRAGAVVLCNPVCVSASSGYCDEDGEIVADSRTLALVRHAANAASLDVTIGSSLTVDRVVASLEEKGRIRDMLGHVVVEMESYWIGRAAANHGVPFLTIRAVSDEAGDSLPDMGFGKSDGTVDYALMSEWARQNPDSIKLLATMSERVRIASAGLTRVAEALLRSELWDSVVADVPGSL